MASAELSRRVELVVPIGNRVAPVILAALVCASRQL
jgi:hypothetical protein